MKKGLFYLVGTVVVFIVLQFTCSYDFLYAEQFRLFRFSSEYAVPFFSQIGGPASLLSAFLLQFFAYPYAGALIATLMFLLYAVAADKLLFIVSKGKELPFFGMLIAIMQTALATETHYSYEQSWALIITLWTLVPLLRVRNNNILGVAAFVALPLLYYLVGIMAILAIVVVLLYLVLTDARKHLPAMCAIMIATVGIAVANHFLIDNDTSHTWTLDAYYSQFLNAPQHSYIPLACLLAGVLVALIIRKHDWALLRNTYFIVAQVVAALALGGWYFSLCHTPGSVRVKKLEVWRWNREWDRILAEDMPTDRIPLYANYQNMALAAQGRLGDEVLNYPQCGTTGLQQVWGGAQQECDLLADIFMIQGHAAMAQKMAFSATQGNEGLMHGRMLLRLIETNLILHNDKVADKYIRILEQTLFYSEKAREYRKFIGHPELVSRDTYLGELQRCTRGGGWCPNDIEEGLAIIIEANPEYKNALHYLGSFYLLQHNMEAFHDFLDKYHDYPGLNPMPESFRKAANQIGWKKPVKTETEQ